MLLGSAKGLLRFVVIKILLLPRTRVGKIGFNHGGLCQVRVTKR